MRAAVCHRYGSPEVIEVRDVPDPLPRARELRIRVHASVVSIGDARIRALRVPKGYGLMVRLVFGVQRPRKPILGMVFAGMVESAGSSASRFAVGDRVFGMSGMRMGCHAQYVCVPETAAIARIPESIGFEQAAALAFGGTTGLEFYRKAQLRAGETVLVNGASGEVGTAMVQLAKHMGAHVTGVCSGRNVELVRSLGADEVVDYEQSDFTQSDKRYDIIVDTAGTAPLSRCTGSLSEGGRLLLVVADLPTTLKAPLAGLVHKKRVIAGSIAERSDDLEQLARLCEAGVLRPVIDQRVTLDQIADAHRLADSGRKRGSAVVVAS